MENAIRVDGLVKCIKCKFDFNINSVKQEVGKYGKIMKCPKCGNRMVLLKRIDPSKEPRIHMNKKARRKEWANKL